jgi:hypothetical protein
MMKNGSRKYTCEDCCCRSGLKPVKHAHSATTHPAERWFIFEAYLDSGCNQGMMAIQPVWPLGKEKSGAQELPTRGFSNPGTDSTTFLIR